MRDIILALGSASLCIALLFTVVTVREVDYQRHLRSVSLFAMIGLALVITSLLFTPGRIRQITFFIMAAILALSACSLIMYSWR